MTIVHHRTCNLCEAMCGITVEADENRVVKISGDKDDPFSRGHICPKAAALKDLHEDPDRLQHPVRREGDRFVRVSWEDALEETAARLHAIQEAHGKDAIAMYVGNPTVHNHGPVMYAPLVLKTLRTKNRFSASTVDQVPHMVAAYHMFGHQLLMPVPDVDRARYMLMLGANPLASNGSLMTAPGIKRRLEELRARGGRLVLVDPRRTETAAIADEHLFVRPGTDALFLLALLHVIVRDHGTRPGHLASRVTNLGVLSDVTEGFTPESTEAHTGIAAQVARRIARALATETPSVVYGRIGVSTQRYGGLCAWLVYVLNLVTGNLDREGGAMFTEPALDIVHPPGGGIGAGSHGRYRSKVRGLPEFGGELPVAVLAEEILDAGDARIRGLVTVAGNPVLSTPDGRGLDDALASLDFMVSIDPYINETTRHAHLILPPPSPLERSHYDAALHLLAVRNTAKWAPALFSRKGDTKEEHEIFVDLAYRLAKKRGAKKRTLLGMRAMAALGPDRLLDAGLRLGPYGMSRSLVGGLSLAKLRKRPHGVDLGPLRPCLLERMPKGRSIDAAPAAILADLDRLRDDVRARASSVDPEGAMVLIGRRHLRSNNSWMHNVPKLVAGKPMCTLLVHPDDAKRLGLSDAAPARVTSKIGSITVPVEISDAMMPGVVSLPHGFGHDRPGVELRTARAHAGVSINDLTDTADVDPLSGVAVLSGVEVRVSAV
jgi:anaerobic selenocysteine-containing dehydrogenase